MKTLKTGVTDICLDQFLTSIEDEARLSECRVLMELMTEALHADATIWGNGTVGFGRYRYEYPGGGRGEWYIAGFAARKSALTISVMPGLHIMGDLLSNLGSYTTGKSCIYVKKLEHIDLEVLGAILRRSAEAMASQRIDTAISESRL